MICYGKFLLLQENVKVKAERIGANRVGGLDATPIQDEIYDRSGGIVRSDHLKSNGVHKGPPSRNPYLFSERRNRQWWTPFSSDP